MFGANKNKKRFLYLIENNAFERFSQVIIMYPQILHCSIDMWLKPENQEGETHTLQTPILYDNYEILNRLKTFRYSKN